MEAYTGAGITYLSGCSCVFFICTTPFHKVLHRKNTGNIVQ
nr:MAG TPA: hypothetical protein [Caudoviricetes sp.]